MAQLMTVRLTRNDGQPWGFRLQGGKDFGSPLALQKVNVGSIADKAGLLAGDALIRVNNEELFNLRHKDAQDALVRAGNSFELTVSRGGSTWKPSVTPLTSPVPTSAGINVVTKTSLKAQPGQNVAAIGTGHNTAAKPFASNGQGVRSIVNKQYNTPVAMYSDETIAETLSAQTEVLAGGVLGVNFKKNEKVYNSAQSEVFKMLQEQGHEPEPARPSSVYSPSSNFAPQHHDHCVAPITQHVSAPVNVPKPPSNNGLPPGQNICADCERLIVGVFVRIKDKNLHVECFKCSTCGSSLKNQGYYNLNNKLYCDIHARLAALNSPPPNSNGMVPVTLAPKAPLNTISSALNAHAFNGTNVAPTTAQLPSTISGPKPFSYAAPSTFAPTSPPQAETSPKSPVAYPPAPAPTWSAPATQAPAWTPKPTESIKAPAVQNLQESKMLLLSYIREDEGRSEVLKGYEDEISRSNTPAFHWPPKPPSEEEERVALAAPIYVAPPETQHIQPKLRSVKGQMLPPSVANANNEQQTCATQLNAMQTPLNISEQPEMYSDASASTSTGDSSSEEYQVYSTNVSQQIVRYYDDPKTNPINSAMNYSSNYATMLRHKPSICSVELDSYIDDNNYDDGKLQEVEEAYLVREPSEQHLFYSQDQDEFQRRTKRVGFTMPPQEVVEYREDSVSQEVKRQSPKSVEGRHGPLYPNSLQIQQELDLYYNKRRESDQSFGQDIDRRYSYGSYDESRRESEVMTLEDKTLSFTKQYCTGDTKFSLLKLEDTKPSPLPSSPNVNSLPQQWQSQMLKALTTTPKEIEKDMDDSFSRACQVAYEQQIEDDRKARDNERRKLMDEMLAKQKAMRERQERNEVDQARRFAPVSKLVPHIPENWQPPQPTPPIALPEEKQAYLPPPPSMEPIRIGPLSFPRMESPLLDALKTASIRPYTPFSSEVASQLCDLPTPIEQMTFSNALITAPDRPFTPQSEVKNYNVPHTTIVDYSKIPTEIYEENAEQIRCLEEEVEQRLKKRASAFAQIRTVKPVTPVQIRKNSYINNEKQLNFPFTDDHVLQTPRPIVCVPQECLNVYESSCSAQQKSYSNIEKRQQERMPHEQIQQQQVQFNQKQEGIIQYQQPNQFKESIRETQNLPKTNKLPPPHPYTRVQSSHRRVQSQTQSPVLLKPDPAGLHKADDIPGYQRKWFNLPSQRASITPEPHELKENVPLAFVAAPKEPSPTISKPIAISAANTYTTTTANPSTSQYNSYQNTYESQIKTLPNMIRKQLAIEPRYSITESQPFVTTVTIEPEEVNVEEEKPQLTQGKRKSPTAVSYQPEDQHKTLHALNEQLIQKSRYSIAEIQKEQYDTKRDSVHKNNLTTNYSQNVEQQVREESLHQSSTSGQKNYYIQEIENKFDLKPQEQQSSVLDNEVQDMVAPQIRVVEPRWRTPSRQYLSEFDAHSSQGEFHMHGESFISDSNENRRPTTPSSRPWTPSRSHHRASHIPYYQEQLAWEEGVALSKEFEKKLRTPSPNSMMRPKSPAFGPPPNPLLLIHPQTRDEGKDLSGKYLSGTKLLSPMWEQQHYKNEYLGMESENPYYEKQQQAALHKEINEISQRQIDGTNQQKNSERHINKCEQLENSCVKQRMKTVEQFETTHSIKATEKTTGATLSIQDDGFPSRGFVAQQARKLSVVDSDSNVNNIVKGQLGSGQEIREFAVPTFRSQVSVQQPNCLSNHKQSYSEKLNSFSSLSQNSQYTFPAKSCVPPTGFPTSAETPPQMVSMMLQQQQQQNKTSNCTATIKTTNSNNKPPLPPATNIVQSSSNPSTNCHDPSPILSSNTNPSIKTSSDPVPGLGGISGKPYNVQNVTQPKRGRGVLNQGVGPSGRSPMCGCCGGQVRTKQTPNEFKTMRQQESCGGPFITALGRIWCPEHFICVNANCKRPLADIGFVEEKGDLYCEYCFEQYLAPNCNKCAKKIKGDCLNAIGKQFHPECFTCSHCGKLFGNSPFFLEEGEPFCQNDWNQLFTTKCFACGFPVEAGDRWVEALNNNYHSQCFNCTMCKKNLEGQSFYAKGGRPFCKNHAR